MKRERDESQTRGLIRIDHKTQNWVVPPGRHPRTLSHCHFVEDRVPLRSLDIGSHIFVKSRSWTAVVTSYFKGLADFGIIGQTFFILPTKCGQNSGVFPVDRLFAMFFMSGDS